MKLFEMTNLISVFEVKDIDKSLKWYKKWLGEPDVVPMENVAEYEIKTGSWLQLSEMENGNITKSSIVIGVKDVKKCKELLEKNDIKAGEIMDYEVVYVFDIFDLDGNTISFAQEL